MFTIINNSVVTPSALKSRLVALCVGIFLSILALQLPYLLPNKEIDLPLSNLDSKAVYGDELLSPVDASKIELGQWTCDVLIGNDYTSCGLALHWHASRAPIDFSGYESIRLNLQYDGPSSRVAIYLVNEGNPEKMNAAFLRGSELDGEIEIRLDEFHVAEWWVEENDIARENVRPEFDAINALEIGFGVEIERGLHRYQLGEATLIGRWVSPQTIHLLLLLCWIAAAVLEVIYRMHELKRRARHYEKELDDAQQEKFRYQKMSVTDKLTGALNRSGLEKEVNRIIDQNSSLEGYSLFVLDIDNYKEINDIHGHNIGDKVLQEFSDLVASRLHEDDVLARWGGDEFVMLVKGVRKSVQLALANRLRKQIAEHRFIKGLSLSITSSIGISVIKQTDSFEEAFLQADQSLFDAKRNGRDRCVAA